MPIKQRVFLGEYLGQIFPLICLLVCPFMTTMTEDNEGYLEQFISLICEYFSMSLYDHFDRL